MGGSSNEGTAVQAGYGTVGVGPAPWKRATVWGVMAGLVTSAVVQYSLRNGRLSAPPDWDDVMYLAYAGERVNDLHSGGIGAFVRGWAVTTPHSPWQCVLAAVAFLVVGLKEWAPYAAAGVVVWGFLLLADWMVGEGKRWGVRVGVMLYLCTIPTVSLAVAEFKPDVAWGLAVSAVAALCVMRPVVGVRRVRWVGLGALCGVTLLVKPTTVPGTVGLLGVCFGVGVVKDWLIGKGNARVEKPRHGGLSPFVIEALRAAGVIGAVALLVAGPFFLVHGRYFRFYIGHTLFGEYRDVWRLPGGPWEQIRYFVTGEGGRVNLGAHVFVLPVIWVAAAVTMVRRGDREGLVRVAGMLVIVSVCYVLATVTPAKNVLLASPMYAVVIATTAYSLGYLLHGQRGWMHAAIVGLVVFGMFAYRWPGVTYAPDSMERAQSERLHRGVMEALETREKAYRQHVVVTATGPVRAVTLAWYAAVGGRRFTFSRPESDRVGDYQVQADRADFVLAQEDAVTGSIAGMPNERVQGKVLEVMRRRGDFRELGDFVASDGKHLVLFARVSYERGVMGWVRAIDGFGPVRVMGKGEAAQEYRWGVAGGGRLLLTPERAGDAELRMVCRAGVKIITVRRAGVELGRVAIKEAWKEQAVVVRVPAALDGEELEIAYEFEGRRPSKGKEVVMYKRIELTSAEDVR